jgi:hypothetical protein
MSDDDDFELRRFLMVAHWQKQPRRERPKSSKRAQEQLTALKVLPKYEREPQRFPKGSFGEKLQRLPIHILRCIGEYLCNGFEHLSIEQACGYTDLALWSPRHKVRIISGYRVGVNGTFLNDLGAVVGFRHIVQLPTDPEVRRKLHWKTIRIPQLYGVFVDALFVWCKAGEVGWGRRDLPFDEILGPKLADWKEYVVPCLNQNFMEEWMVVLTMTREDEEAKGGARWALQIFQFDKRRICCEPRENRACGGTWACEKLFMAKTMLGEQWEMWDSPCVVHHLRRYTEVFEIDPEREPVMTRYPPAQYFTDGQPGSGKLVCTNTWGYPEEAIYLPWEWTLRRMPFSSQWNDEDE